MEKGTNGTYRKIAHKIITVLRKRYSAWEGGQREGAGSRRVWRERKKKGGFWGGESLYLSRSERTNPPFERRGRRPGAREIDPKLGKGKVRGERAAA